MSSGHLQPPWLRRSEANPSSPTTKRPILLDWSFCAYGQQDDGFERPVQANSPVDCLPGRGPAAAGRIRPPPPKVQFERTGLFAFRKRIAGRIRKAALGKCPVDTCNRRGMEQAKPSYRSTVIMLYCFINRISSRLTFSFCSSSSSWFRRFLEKSILIATGIMGLLDRPVNRPHFTSVLV